MLRLLPCWVKSLQIGTERIHAQSGDMLRHIEPMGADIGHATRGASSFNLDAPVPIRVVKKPVLGIRTLHNENFAEISSFAHGAHLLHHWVVAQVVADAIA